MTAPDMSKAPSSLFVGEPDKEILESVIRLTEQRDEEALVHSLVDAVVEMVPGVRCAHVKLIATSDHRHWHVTEVIAKPDPLFAIPDWLYETAACPIVEDHTQLFGSPDGEIMLACLHHDAESRSALLFRKPHWDAHDRNLVEAMLKIHANFAKLLMDSERDTLTGLYNRKKLSQKLSELLANMQPAGRRHLDHEEAGDFLVAFDIDHFKRVNDSYGHLIGDEVLIIFSGLVQKTLRDSDWVFRYGGEEFVALLKNVTPFQAQHVLERIRERVATYDFPQVGHVTVSMGYTRIDGQPLPPDVIEEADKALYYAKEHGRNQVQSYEDLVRRGELERGERESGSVELF